MANPLHKTKNNNIKLILTILVTIQLNIRKK